MNSISIRLYDEELDSVDNWAGPSALFPRILVNQATAEVSITRYSVCNRKRGQYGCCHELDTVMSEDGQVLRITGLVGLRNDRRRTGGRQNFCFYVFRGDSYHLYVHRAVASKGWMNCNPEKVLKRLLKIGIGAVRGVIQQGDYLLKPANGLAYPEEEFKHESMGTGHHKFDCPQLYATGVHGRQYRITEPVRLRHTATDGIQHPDVMVKPGTYIVGTTSESLPHPNRRD